MPFVLVFVYLVEIRLYQDSRFFLMVSDQFVCFVFIISSSFVIICGHFMFIIFLMRFLWKVSIFFYLCLVNVHRSLFVEPASVNV